MYDIILKKRNGGELTREEIEFFVEGYVEGRIPDYQAAALLMAIYFQGMSSRETVDLTMSMASSGRMIDLSSIEGVKVDKHSTGGVADTTTLIVAPLVACCGMPVAKMSGRGLGHTGGTIDKLESIPGFKVDLSIDDFVRQVRRVGVAIASQSEYLVPADRKIYALRDVTATVDSIPLIASSVMSKKIAAGADVVVLDVKAGSGAFMKTVDKAFELAREMVNIGVRSGVRTMAIVTDMNEPLGAAIGNALEVREAIEVLKDLRSGRLRELSLTLGTYILVMAGRCKDTDEARGLLIDALESGRGLEKFKEMIRAQGGDERVVDDPDLLPVAKKIIPVKAKKKGYIASVEAQLVGICALLLGAGRTTKEEAVDHAVGIVMKKQRGDRVEEGDVIAEFHVNKEEQLNEAIGKFNNAIVISDRKPERRPLVYGVVKEDGSIEKFDVWCD